MSDSKIEVRQPNLKTQLDEMKSRGTLRIPRFQRDYVWERTRVAKLFDSIYKGFPIGSFFLWITPPEFRHLHKDIPELNFPTPSDYEPIKMILDGQQRLTSLHVTACGLKINGKDYKKICFNLDTQEFFVATRGEDKEKTISVWRFFDRKGEDEVYDSLSVEHRKIFRGCRDTLHGYPLSVVEVKDMHLSDAITIFERINQGGKRLNLFDLVVANTWSDDFDLKQEVKELNKQLEQTGFGKIDEEIIAQLLSLVLRGQCTSAFQLSIENSEIKNEWKRAVESIKLAIDYLSQNLGVKVFDFTPYPSMIALVAYLFMKVEGRTLNPTQVSFVKEWFWKATFSQRYGKSAMTLMGNDRADYFDPILAGEKVNVRYAVTIDKEDLLKQKIHTRSAIKNGVFCILALKNPLNFSNGTVVPLTKQLCSSYNDAEKHHIFPKAMLRRLGYKQLHQLLNFSFTPNELNVSISDNNPSEYFSNFKNTNPNFEETLKSHLIPFDNNSGIWSDDYDLFLSQRNELIFKEIEELVGSISPITASLENKPQEALEDLESGLREFINEVMSERVGEKYWDLFPQGIQERLKERLAQRAKRHPYEENKILSGYEMLSFCDVMDYAQIIQKNWEYFSGYFRSLGEVERHFLNLKDYRNSLMHNRPMNTVERKQGEASAEWVSKIISPSENESEDEINSEEDDTEDLEDSNLTDKEIIIKKDDVDVRGILMNGGKIKVLKDSFGIAQNSDSFVQTHTYRRLKDKLLEDGIIVLEDGKLIFKKDYIFESTSAAAAVILSRPASGPDFWKIK